MRTPKKPTKTRSASASTQAPPQTARRTAATGVVDAPPTGPLPAPPSASAARDPEEFRGFHPKGAQVAATPRLAAELANATDYAQRFGPGAPKVTALVMALGLATEWRRVREAIALYAEYTRMQDGLAWKEALTLLRRLEPLYDAAVTHDPTVVRAYPVLAHFFAVPEVFARTGVITRKKNAKAKAAERATSDKAPGKAPGTGRVVTVSG